eukprot:2075030-Rhodomonas_salina.1
MRPPDIQVQTRVDRRGRPRSERARAEFVGDRSAQKRDFERGRSVAARVSGRAWTPSGLLQIGGMLVMLWRASRLVALCFGDRGLCRSGSL